MFWCSCPTVIVQWCFSDVSKGLLPRPTISFNKVSPSFFSVFISFFPNSHHTLKTLWKSWSHTLLGSKDCTFMQLNFPITDTVREESVATAFLRIIPQHHFQWHHFFCLQCALKLFPFIIVEIQWHSFPIPKLHTTLHDEITIHNNKNSYLSQLIALHQTLLEPKGYLLQIWRWKPGYQLL